MNTPAVSESWAAPIAHSPVRADVSVPGSKSLTNRYLVLAALADGTSMLRRPLRSRDTLLMVKALRSLGIRLDEDGDDIVVTPAAVNGNVSIDCGLAGTVMRFVPPVAALADDLVAFDGDQSARRRPMGPVLDGLRAIGVSVDGDALPFTVRGSGAVRGGRVVLDASGSSQFISALLLAGARFTEGITIVHDGGPLPSQPHIDMTIAVLRAAGVRVDDSEANTWRVQPGPIRALDVVVEPDLSNAAPFIAAACVTGGEVSIADWPRDTTQAGDQLRGILASMGATVALGTNGLTVRQDQPLRGIDADLHEVGELTPVIAALAALAEGPSYLRGIAHLRHHETDRLAALTNELNALGGDVTELDDGLAITPKPLHGGLFHTYGDHRMVMAAAVLGLRVEGVEIEDVHTVGKTLPTFTTLWDRMLSA